MNAAVVHDYSAPPRYETFDDPVPKEGERLVRVSAAGLHPLVKAVASGRHYSSSGVLPMVPGSDGVGRLEDGSRVYFAATRPPYGSMAERSVTRAWLPIPESPDDATVAAMMNPGMSSFGALTQRIEFAKGESILILGATGSAGQLAVQIAKRLGARRVVGAGRDAEALEETKRLGADATISLKQEHEALVAALREEIAGQKIDVVLDYVWGAPAEAALEAIAARGRDLASRRIRYVEVGAMAGPTISLPAATLRSSGLEMVGSGLGSVPMEKILRALSLFVAEAAREPFEIKTATAPLREVERRWNERSEARLVLQP
jgi:NADPH2:quinone reductase